MPPFAEAVVVVFGLLALIHRYWALGGRRLEAAAIPEVHGRAAFVPSALVTFVVAVDLTLCAWLIATTAVWHSLAGAHPEHASGWDCAMTETLWFAS